MSQHDHEHGSEHDHSEHSHDSDHHDHAHPHSHHLVTDLSQLNRAFLFGILINLGFVIIETFYGMVSGSVALLADAGHNFQDVLSLALSAFTLWLAKRPTSSQRTYGYQKSTILSSLANSILLVFACALILWESFQRFHHGHAVNGETILIVALIGVAVNAGSAFLFSGSSELNSRGAFLHLMLDAFVSLAVAISGLLVMKTGYVWIDPVVSIGVAAIILYSTWSLLRDSLNLALDTVPEGLSVEAVKKSALETEGVIDLHHIHIWPLSTYENAMTAHVLVKDAQDHANIIRVINRKIQDAFAIHHITLQIEVGTLNEHPCSDSEHA